MGSHKKLPPDHRNVIQKWIQDYKFKIVPDPDKDYVGPWGLHLEKKYNSQAKVLRIKRFIKYENGSTTWQRLNFSFYKDFLTNNTELRRILSFINDHDPGEYLSGFQLKVRSAYLPTKYIDGFHKKVDEEFINDDKKDIHTRLRRWRFWGIEWFLKRDHNPLKWKLYEKEWGIALLNMKLLPKDKRILPPQELRSKNTLINVVWLMNNFFEYLYYLEPNKYPLIAFKPISKLQFSDLLEARKKRKMVKERGHIPENDWRIIRDHIRKDPDLAVIELCYEFGLRRNEALAINQHSLRKESLYVTEQIKGDFKRHERKEPKRHSKRHIPYYVSELTTRDIIKIVDTNLKSATIPFSINMKWRELMKSLGFKYDIHDCRHSFCRRIVQKYDAKAAMEFAGHKSIVTTNQYLQSKTAWSEERLLYDVSNI